jgi:hypothetical protein
MVCGSLKKKTSGSDSSRISRIGSPVGAWE